MARGSWQLSYYMGASLMMIDCHYGHRPRRTRTRNRPPWTHLERGTFVDGRWTLKNPYPAQQDNEDRR